MSETAPRTHPAIEAAWVVDRYLLFDERDGVVHELSPSASAVWHLVDGATTGAAIAEELSRQVGRDISADVHVAVTDFARLGLLSDAAGDQA